MSDKFKTIECILEINQGTCREFLSRFDVEQLQQYHDHLQRTIEPRGRGSIWSRKGDTPAVVTRRPAA